MDSKEYLKIHEEYLKNKKFFKVEPYVQGIKDLKITSKSNKGIDKLVKLLKELNEELVQDDEPSINLGIAQLDKNIALVILVVNGEPFWCPFEIDTNMMDENQDEEENRKTLLLLHSDNQPGDIDLYTSKTSVNLDNNAKFQVVDINVNPEYVSLLMQYFSFTVTLSIYDKLNKQWIDNIDFNIDIDLIQRILNSNAFKNFYNSVDLNNLPFDNCTFTELYNGIPNVILASYNPYQNSQEFVDLGLPSGTLWAKCNLGASQEHELGEKHNFDYDELTSAITNQYGEGENLQGISMPSGEYYTELANYTKQEIITDYNGNLCVKCIKYIDKENDIVDEDTYVVFPISTTEESLECTTYMSQVQNSAQICYYMHIRPGFVEGGLTQYYSDAKKYVKLIKISEQETFVNLGLPSGKLWAKYNFGGSDENSQGIDFSQYLYNRDPYIGEYSDNIPSTEDFSELFQNTNKEFIYDDQNYSRGIKFINKSDSSRFIIISFDDSNSAMVSLVCKNGYGNNNSCKWVDVVDYGGSPEWGAYQGGHGLQIHKIKIINQFPSQDQPITPEEPIIRPQEPIIRPQ